MSEPQQRPRIRPALSQEWPEQDRARTTSAAEDSSTYYEYIERHTGDLPATPVRQGYAPTAASAEQSDTANPFRAHDVHPTADAPLPTYASAAGGRKLSDSWSHAAIETVPEPGSSARSTGIKVGIVVLSMLAVLACVAFFGVRWLAPSSGSVPVAGDTQGDKAEQIPVTGSDTARSAPASGERSRAVASPEQALDGIVADDAEQAAALDGRWVTQISAKNVGLTADGHTWTAEDILTEFESNQVKYPGAILIFSGDWGSFRSGDYWVTVIDTPYDEPGPALTPCRNWGLDRDHCLAKRLVKHGSPEGNSAYLDK